MQDLSKRKVGKMLSDKEKNILKNGSFMEQSSLLLNKFNDERWIKEANKYFRKIHKSIFTKSHKLTTK